MLHRGNPMKEKNCKHALLRKQQAKLWPSSMTSRLVVIWKITHFWWYSILKCLSFICEKYKVLIPVVDPVEKSSGWNGLFIIISTAIISIIIIIIIAVIITTIIISIINIIIIIVFVIIIIILRFLICLY